MSNERLYSDEEIARIFEQAARVQTEALQRAPHNKGLTLDELQRIGAEAGLSPAYVAQAARAMDHSVEEKPNRTFVGVPVGVSRSIQLPRALTKDEWSRLVMDMRDTFQASGTLKETGNFREWRNGNLSITSSTAGDESELQLRTFKRSGRDFLGTGLFLSAMALAMILVTFIGDPTDTGLYLSALLLLCLGLPLFVYQMVDLQRWSRTRADQMEALAERALVFTQGPLTSAPDNQEAAETEGSGQPVSDPPASTPALSLDRLDVPDTSSEVASQNRSRT